MENWEDDRWRRFWQSPQGPQHNQRHLISSQKDMPMRKRRTIMQVLDRHPFYHTSRKHHPVH